MSGCVWVNRCFLMRGTKNLSINDTYNRRLCRTCDGEYNVNGDCCCINKCLCRRTAENTIRPSLRPSRRCRRWSKSLAATKKMTVPSPDCRRTIINIQNPGNPQPVIAMDFLCSDVFCAGGLLGSVKNRWAKKVRSKYIRMYMIL